MIWLGVMPSPGHHSEENQSHSTLMLILISKLQNATELQSGPNKLNNQEPPPFNQENASIYTTENQITKVLHQFQIVLVMIRTASLKNGFMMNLNNHGFMIQSLVKLLTGTLDHSISKQDQRDQLLSQNQNLHTNGSLKIHLKLLSLSNTDSHTN